MLIICIELVKSIVCKDFSLLLLFLLFVFDDGESESPNGVETDFTGCGSISVRTSLCYNISFQLNIKLKCSLCGPILQTQLYLQSCKHILQACSHVYNDKK